MYKAITIMQSNRRSIRIDIASQTLELREGDAVLARFPVSTAANGVGFEPGSMRTPTGRFEIAEKIGDGAPLGMVFRERLPTAEIGGEGSSEDLIETRIMWLNGLDAENANTLGRYIYIHGTNHESLIGQPVSHGCIRMRNADIIALYDAVDAGALVEIQP